MSPAEATLAYIFAVTCYRLKRDRFNKNWHSASKEKAFQGEGCLELFEAAASCLHMPMAGQQRPSFACLRSYGH